MSPDYEIEEQKPRIEKTTDGFAEPEETEADLPAKEKPEEVLFFWSEPGVCG